MACETVASEGCVVHHAVSSVNVRWGTCDGTCNFDRSPRMTTSALLGPGVITRLVDEPRARGRWPGCASHCDPLSTDVLRTERSFCTRSVGLGSARMMHLWPDVVRRTHWLRDSTAAPTDHTGLNELTSAPDSRATASYSDFSSSVVTSLTGASCRWVSRVGSRHRTPYARHARVRRQSNSLLDQRSFQTLIPSLFRRCDQQRRSS
jgi:hypothetical protein